jgi:beta-1,4-mannosyltransferase
VQRTVKHERAWTVYANLSSANTNPYSALWLDAMSEVATVRPLRLGRTLQPRRGDVVHLHWPEHYHPSHRRLVAFARLVRFVAWLGLLRLRGARLVATIHNTGAHDRREDVTDRLFWWVLPRLVHGAVVHAEGGRSALIEARPGFRRVPILTVKHPIYPRFAPPSADVERELVSSVGSMRPYKRIDRLVAAYGEAWRTGHPGLPVLYLAGARYPGMDEVERQVADLVAAGASVRSDWRPLEMGELEGAIDRSLLVAITHLPSLASGSMLQVLSLGAVLLAPRGWFTDELAADFGEHVILYEEPLTAGTLVRATTLARRHTCDPASCVVPDAYRWSVVAARQVDLYAEL